MGAKITFLFVLFVSCSPLSLKDLRCEADAEMRKLALELRGFETKEDLQQNSKRIKKRFNKLAQFLIETRKFTEGNSEISSAAEELFIELARLYEAPGAKETIESLQEEAVRLIDKKSRV
jgi:nitric oxide reductase activation protein